MTVHELNRHQLIQLKVNYLVRMDDEGSLNDVLYGREEWDNDGNHHLSYGEILSADDLIPDEWIFDYHSSTEFSEDDFCDNDFAMMI